MYSQLRRTAGGFSSTPLSSLRHRRRSHQIQPSFRCPRFTTSRLTTASSSPRTTPTTLPPRRQLDIPSTGLLDPAVQPTSLRLHTMPEGPPSTSPAIPRDTPPAAPQRPDPAALAAVASICCQVSPTTAAAIDPSSSSRPLRARPQERTHLPSGSSPRLLPSSTRAAGRPTSGDPSSLGPILAGAPLPRFHSRALTAQPRSVLPRPHLKHRHRQQIFLLAVGADPCPAASSSFHRLDPACIASDGAAATFGSLMRRHPLLVPLSSFLYVHASVRIPAHPRPRLLRLSLSAISHPRPLPCVYRDNKEKR